jgi:hypothetical protein
MKKIKSLNIEINTKILEHTSTKLSKILENTINPNNINIKQQYWIKKLIELMVDEISYKDIKITNTSWESVFDMYNKKYTPEKASKELIRLDEALSENIANRIKSLEPYQVDGKARRRISKFFVKYKKKDEIELDDIIKDSNTYDDLEFSDLLNAIVAIRDYDKHGLQKRKDGSYGFVDFNEVDNPDESIRIPDELFSPEASRKISTDDTYIVNRKKDVLIPSNRFKFKKDAIKRLDALKSNRKGKIPYIHNKSIDSIRILDDKGNEYTKIVDGNKIPYDLNKLRDLISTRPEKMLSQNMKAKHSSGDFEVVWNLGLPALRGLIIDESDPNRPFVITSTCPGAGSCINVCFAMKGGYVQYENSFLKLNRMLNYLINDYDGFRNQLISEINSLYNGFSKTASREKTTFQLLIRYHDAGDFFSPAYVDLAEDVANHFAEQKIPIIFYAYTKEPSAYKKLDKLPNFILNFSEGSRYKINSIFTDEDEDYKKTKLSVIVNKLKGDVDTDNDDLVNSDKAVEVTKPTWKKYAHLIDSKDENGNPVMVSKKITVDGVKKYIKVPKQIYVWNSQNDWLKFRDLMYNEYKDRYGIDNINDILRYGDWITNYPRNKFDTPENKGRFFVAILPGVDGDLAASRGDVRISLLLIH